MLKADKTIIVRNKLIAFIDENSKREFILNVAKLGKITLLEG
jgi:hypothetical protein